MCSVRPADPYRQTQMKFLQKVRKLHYSSDRASKEPPMPEAVSPQMSVISSATRADDARSRASKRSNLDDKSQHEPPVMQLPKLLVKKCREDVNEVDYAPTGCNNKHSCHYACQCLL